MTEQEKRSATDILRAEHREVENHLDALHATLRQLAPERVEEMRQTVHDLRRLVGAHMELEERVFYPAVQPLVEDLLPEMLKQHERMRQADRFMGELLMTFPASPADRDMGELYRLGIELHDAIEVHIVDEEEQLLKRVDERLTPQQRQSLLAAMEQAAPGHSPQ